MKITQCSAKEIFDSRGVPTIEVKLFSGDISVVAGVPSGKSTGSKEALEKRDSDGRGITKAIASVEDVISPEIIGKNVTPDVVDRLLLELDGTENKSNLGANAILGVSIAVTKLAAAVEGVPVWKFIADTNSANARLPKLFMNIINGGAHSDFQPNSEAGRFRLPFQEYMIVPKDELVSVSYKKAQKIINILGVRLKERFGEVPLGDEGGYSPVFESVEEPFALLDDIISGEDMFLAIDAAATEFYKDGKYNLLNKEYSSLELLGLYKKLTEEFELLSIEDPFEESDAESFSNLVGGVSGGVLVVGDDLTVTNPSLITEMAEKKAANAVIIKPNQIGTLLEVYEAVTLAHGYGWKTIASHRSGETLDTFISDLAVGVGAYGIKAGSPLQKEREVKYHRLLEIEQEFKKYN